MSVLGIIETLPELSAYQAKQRGDAVAFVFEQRTLSYRELDKHANQIANGILAEGILPQARIAMLSKDSDNGYALLFGSAKARTVLIGINWRLAAQEILYIINQGQAELLFVGAEFFAVIESIRTELTTVKKIIALDGQHPEWLSWLDWREQHYTSTPGLTYSPDDVVVQMYTSGTTGHPKGVQIPNYSFFRLMAGMRAQGDNWMGLTASDSLLVALPQFHMGGIWWAIQGLIAGATNVLMSTFVAWQALELIAKHRISLVEMVPSMLQTALDEPGVTTTDLSSVRGFLYGGSPIAPALFKRAIQVFNCDFYQIYGMTETGNMAVCLRPQDHYPLDSPRLLSAGKALPGVAVCVLGTNNQTLPQGSIGEICIKSPANTPGYWHNDEANLNTFFNQWIRTGDVGYLDQDGYVFVCDRIKDMIICGGENIYPAEIEAVLQEHPLVVEAAVIGIPDARWGESVKAFVVLRNQEKIKQRELINFVRSRIADFKAPKSIDFVARLPRNSSGKLLKRELRAPYWSEQQRQIN